MNFDLLGLLQEIVRSLDYYTLCILLGIPLLRVGTGLLVLTAVMIKVVEITITFF